MNKQTGLHSPVSANIKNPFKKSKNLSKMRRENLAKAGIKEPKSPF